MQSNRESESILVIFNRFFGGCARHFLSEKIPLFFLSSKLYTFNTSLSISLCIQYPCNRMGHIAKKSKPSAPAAKASKAIPVAIVTAVDTDSDSSSESSSDEGESDSESEAEVAIAKSQVKGQAEESSEEENSDSSEEESDEDDSDDEEEEVTNLLTLTTTTTATVVQGEEDEEVGGEPKLKMGRIERRKRAEKAVAEDQEKAIAASLVVLPDMEAPPKGYPTALEAVTNTIVTLGAAGAEGKVALLCVICPTKKLQEGTMLEVHLKGKVRSHSSLFSPGSDFN